MKSVAVLFLTGLLILTSPLAAHAHTNVDMDFYNLFEHHGEIMLLVDSATGKIIHVNVAASDFYGYSQKELESMNIFDINALPRDEVEKSMQDATINQNNSFTFQHRLASGEIRYVEVYSRPHTQGDQTVLFSTIHDVTDNMQLAERNRLMTITLLMVLSGTLILVGVFSILLLRSKRRLEKLNSSIKEREDSLRLLLDSTAEGIYGIDLDGICTLCNTSSLKLLGFGHQDELIGKNMHQMIHAKHFDGAELPQKECHIISALTEGKCVHIENEVFWRADGTCFPVEYYSYPQYRNGVIVGAVVTFVDITERKRTQDQLISINEQLGNANRELQEKQYYLEEQNAIIEELNSQLEDEIVRYQRQKEILQAIIDSFGAGIVMVDQKGRITFINEAWKALFNYYDYSGYHFNGSFYLNDNTCYSTEAFIQEMMTGMENSQGTTSRLISLIGDKKSRYAVDLEQTTPIKRFLHLYSNPCISYKNHNFGRVFVVRDVSHQKEVDRLKLQLVTTVSHELRTPMSSILGFSELLLTRKLSKDRSNEYVALIHSEAKRLTNLINDFLDIQRMESGKQVFNKEIHSLDEIIEDAVKLFKNVRTEHSITFNKKRNSLPKVFCDKDKILQVMSNLLSNAVKYSPEGGGITVELAEQSHQIKVSVIDRGLGIPEDVKDKLFTKFYRVDNDDRRKIGGTGLGLAICKEIIKSHGGEIGVESIYGQGSTFYFLLPYTEEGKGVKTKNNDSNSLSPTDQESLLIVEDDHSMVRLIREVLKAEDMEMHDVSSGEQALKLIAERRYTLIILDIALSGDMNGWDVLRELKRNPVAASTPIIISSVYENKDIAVQKGIADYLVKPFEPEQLVRLVKKAINGKLDSKMMLNGDRNLAKEIMLLLRQNGIDVKQIERFEDSMIITLEGGESIEGKG